MDPHRMTSEGRLRTGRGLLALLFLGSGVLHLVTPVRYVGIVPRYLPLPGAIVLVSGIAEIAGAIGLLIPGVRRAAGIGLILLLIAVFPANVEMLQQGMANRDSVVRLTVLWFRLPIQPLLIWWVWLTAVQQAKPAGVKSGGA